MTLASAFLCLGHSDWLVRLRARYVISEYELLYTILDWLGAL